MDENTARIFNTALLSHKTKQDQNFSAELMELMAGPAFTAILQAVKNLAEQTDISEQESAHQIITAFHKMDRIWSDYVFGEGIQKLKTPAH